MATTRISDIIVPQVFDTYMQQYTEVKSVLIRSGALVTDSHLSELLAGGGLMFNSPSFKDLADDPENISSDDPAVLSSPYKIGTAAEVQVRLSRNNSWSSMDLAGTLAGADPMMAIVNRVSDYWVRRLQDAWIAMMLGVFADNAAAPTGGDTHTINDLTFDASGASFIDGTTNFSTEVFMDALQTMGDSQNDLSLVVMHSVVYTRAKKNNLIDFISDSVNGNAMQVPTFLGHRVVVDDRMPNAAGVFQTWFFAPGATRFGQGQPPIGTEVDRIAASGNGGGQDILHNRREWMLHPVGHAYIGTPAAGGPANLATANNLANAASWRRVFTERKQIKIARLVTREF